MGTTRILFTVLPIPNLIRKQSMLKACVSTKRPKRESSYGKCVNTIHHQNVLSIKLCTIYVAHGKLLFATHN